LEKYAAHFSNPAFGGTEANKALPQVLIEFESDSSPNFHRSSLRCRITEVELTVAQKLNQGTSRKLDVIIFGLFFFFFGRSKKERELIVHLLLERKVLLAEIANQYDDTGCNELAEECIHMQ
jgi:hypothetical protein